MTGQLADAGPARLAAAGIAPLSTERGPGAVRRGAGRRPSRCWCPIRLDLAALRARRPTALPPLLRGLVRGRARRAAAGDRRRPAALARRAAGRRWPRPTSDRLLLDLVRAQRRRGARPRRRRRDRPRPGVQGPRLRLADRRRAAQPAQRGHRPAAARHAGLRPPDPTALAGYLLAQLVPDSGPALPPVLTDLENLERSLAEATLEAELHAQIGSRLEVLMAKWRTMRTGPGGDPGTGPDLDIDGASDDEIFDLIDSELGL